MEILHLEDHLLTAAAFRDLVADECPGATVLHAANCRDAVSLLDEKQIHLIFADFCCPGLNSASKTGGADLYGYSSRHYPLTPFYVLSDSPQSEIIETFRLGNLPPLHKDRIVEKRFISGVTKIIEALARSPLRREPQPKANAALCGF